uniref:Putative secreted protein n=1 Tax=Anopheles triannulatus TaxID=58253 RepID=A0A2M4B3A0_9DIPT
MLPSELFDLWLIIELTPPDAAAAPAATVAPDSLPNIFCTMFGRSGCIDTLPSLPPAADVAFPTIFRPLAAPAPRRSDNRRALLVLVVLALVPSLLLPDGEGAKGRIVPPAPPTPPPEEDCCFCFLLPVDDASLVPATVDPRSLVRSSFVPSFPACAFAVRADSFGIWNLVSSVFANPSALALVG